ncbi:MAG: glycosyltransferase family 9 protein, partial [Nitrospinales bacterium]
MNPANKSIDPPRKILLIKLGAVGDLVIASAFFDALKKHFSDSEIVLLVGKTAAPVVTSHPVFNRILLTDDKIIYHGNPISRLREVIRVIRKLRKERFDLVFVMHRAWQFNLLALMSGIHRRVGFTRGREGFGLTDRVVSPPDQNQREAYLDLLRILGVPAVYEKTFYYLSEEEEKFLPVFLQENGIEEDERVLAIGPGGGKNAKLYMPNKRWPEQNFMTLIQKILREKPFRILLVGGPNDLDTVSRIRERFPECLDATHLSFGEMASVFRRCTLFIGNDSGPLHIAAAMGIPTLSFFGPTLPAEWAPPGPQDTVFYKAVEC